MTPLLLSLVLSACELPQGSTVAPEATEDACALLAQQKARSPDRAALSVIYDEPGFEGARKRNDGAWKLWLDRALAWLKRVFETSGAAAYSNVTRFLVLALAAVIGAWSVAWLLSRRLRKKLPAHHESAAEPMVLDDPAKHLERARSLLGAAPREALREGLLALLSQLERSRLARPDRVKTNRELARELPGRGASAALSSEVQAALTRYDRAYYSQEPVAPELATKLVEDLAQAAGRAKAEVGA